MANYQSVKINFDLDDPHHKELYEYLKGQTNGSSFIRTLLYQTKNSNKNYSVVNEQIEVKSEQPETDVVSETKSATVHQATHNNIKLFKEETKITVDYNDLI